MLLCRLLYDKYDKSYIKNLNFRNVLQSNFFLPTTAGVFLDHVEHGLTVLVQDFELLGHVVRY